MISLLEWFPAASGLVDEVLPQFLSIVRTDVLRYFLGAGLVYAIVNNLLARRLANRKIRPDCPSNKQMRREILVSIRTALIFATTGTAIALGATAGVYRISLYPDALGWTWFGLSSVVLIVLHDAWFYWTHRLIHHPALFRRCHRTHHRSFNPSPWTAYAFDVGEAAVNALYLPLVLLILPVSIPALIVFTTHMILRNAIGHCGYELFPSRADGRPMFDWMTTVTHHDLHHAQAGSNYGLYFTWWDRWMGTENPNYLEAFAAASGRRSEMKPT
jgi:lathosterol oxidase